MIKPSKMPSILFVMSHFVELEGSYVCVGYVENIGYTWKITCCNVMENNKKFSSNQCVHLYL